MWPRLAVIAHYGHQRALSEHFFCLFVWFLCFCFFKKLCVCAPARACLVGSVVLRSNCRKPLPLLEVRPREVAGTRTCRCIWARLPGIRRMGQKLSIYSRPSSAHLTPPSLTQTCGSNSPAFSPFACSAGTFSLKEVLPRHTLQHHRLRPRSCQCKNQVTASLCIQTEHLRGWDVPSRRQGGSGVPQDKSSRIRCWRARYKGP